MKKTVGHERGLATHLLHLAPAEIGKRATAFFSQMAGAEAGSNHA